MAVSGGGALLANGVRDLQSIHGDEAGELLQTLDEADLPAELLTVDRRSTEPSHKQTYCC